MGRYCGTYGRQQTCIQGSESADVRERDHLVNLGIDGENVKMDLQEVGWDRDWLDLAQDRDRLRAVVNATMNFELRFTQLSALESLFLRATHPEMHEA
jgi:hypothetical protein